MISSSLFHFTNDIENIRLILQGLAFRATYNFENVEQFKFAKKFLAVPMVCFCDIPLKFVGPHASHYGRYGLGLSKQWAIEKRINPLQYILDDSPISLAFQHLNRAAEINSGDQKQLPVEEVMRSEMPIKANVKDEVFNIVSFTKPYVKGDRVFYLEREWRFVPNLAELYFQDDETIEARNALNQRYFNGNPDMLNFLLLDLKHIVVPDMEQVNMMLTLIDSLNIGKEQKYLLTQKIVDLVTIEKDF
jgi:hypothetical protein